MLLVGVGGTRGGVVHACGSRQGIALMAGGNGSVGGRRRRWWEGGVDGGHSCSEGRKHWRAMKQLRIEDNMHAAGALADGDDVRGARVQRSVEGGEGRTRGRKGYWYVCMYA